MFWPNMWVEQHQNSLVRGDLSSRFVCGVPSLSCQKKNVTYVRLPQLGWLVQFTPDARFDPTPPMAEIRGSAAADRPPPPPRCALGPVGQGKVWDGDLAGLLAKLDGASCKYDDQGTSEA